MPLPAASSTLDGAHDFDFHFGVWKTHIRRLQKPLTGSSTWADYDGTSVVSKVWGGRASILELEANGPAGHIEGVGLRLFNPQSHQWSLNWTNSTDPVMTTPMVGRFVHGLGQFYDHEEFQGRIIMARNGFSAITPNSSRASTPTSFIVATDQRHVVIYSQWRDLASVGGMRTNPDMVAYFPRIAALAACDSVVGDVV